MATGGDIPKAWIDKVKALASGEVLTATAPGKWAGKEPGHVPAVTRNDDGSVTVKINHVMKKGEEDKDDHWIEFVWVQDAAGTVVAIAKFAPTDPQAAITFTPEAGKTYTPYESCNLHGVWKGDAF